ncbi:MAG: dihydrofolate reductase family protein [Pseudonocardiales bacterium]|nr:dihydrofolate reductase family protein [Actinomycetota bacterium]
MGPPKTIWHLTMSLDGFMADDHGSLDWMPRDAGSAPMGTALIPTIGAILAGRRTYDGGVDVATDDRRPYGGAYTGPVFVLTHRPGPAPLDSWIHFVTAGLPAALATARGSAGAGNVVIFGADVGQQCLASGELDELLVHIAPVLIGSGTPAFGGVDGMRAFRVLERSEPGDVTTLRLAPQ